MAKKSKSKKSAKKSSSKSKKPPGHVPRPPKAIGQRERPSQDGLFLSDNYPLMIPGGPGAAGVCSEALARTLVERPGGVPIAVGVFPFTGSRPARLVIPARAVARLEPGDTREWMDEGFREAGEGGVETAVSSSPHDAFSTMQLRPVPAPEAYAASVATAIERIRAGKLDKVVLARAIDVEAGRVLDPSALLHRLRAVDPEAFVFSAPSGDGRRLVGATPELLVARRGREVRSTPLAGSAPRSGDPEEDRASAARLAASSKEREEHAVVVEGVAEALGPFCDELHADPEPVLLATANVWHLATRFRGVLREPAADALALVGALHPTPAVCGSPRAAALDLIGELEPFDRGCYAGPVGWMDAAGDGDWAIALRCAELSGSEARLFAGAGIVSGSDPASETDETERKFRAFLDSLRWG